MTPTHSPHADAISPSRQRRQAHALALLTAVSAVGAAVVLHLVGDARPLEVQLSHAFGDAHHALNGWQDQLSRGLQVSLLAVADGRELHAPRAATRPTTGRETAASAPEAAAQVPAQDQ